MNDLSRPLKEKRRKEGLSLRDLEKILGVGFSTLNRVERGIGDVTYKNRKRITAWLSGEDQVEELRDLVFVSSEECRRMARLLLVMADRLEEENAVEDTKKDEALDPYEECAQLCCEYAGRFLNPDGSVEDGRGYGVAKDLEGKCRLLGIDKKKAKDNSTSG